METNNNTSRQPLTPPSREGLGGGSSNWRWWLCGLLFVATTVNYLDRQVLSLTWKDFIAPEFHWTNSTYGSITAAFSLLYAFVSLFSGKFIDWIGTKKGYLIAIFVWSLGACMHASCGWLTMHFHNLADAEALRMVEAGSALALGISTTSMWLFMVCRTVLALGESGNFPAAIKVVAEYFPKKDRALATSIFNAGASVGALVAPVSIPFLAKAYGWEMAFIIIGAMGFLWMGFWWAMYDKPEESKHVSKAELEYINQDEGRPTPQPLPCKEGSNYSPDNGGSEKSVNEESASSQTVTAPSLQGRTGGGSAAPSLSFIQCLTLRPTWSFIAGKFFTDGVWWFLLFWAPAYFSDQYGYRSDSAMGATLIFLVYLIVTVVSIGAGGYIPKYLIERRGMEAYAGRLRAMFLFAVLPVFALFAQPLGSYSAWWPAIIIGLAGAGHQSWSANLYSTIGDMFPKNAIATITGIGTMAGGIASFIINQGAGMLFDYSEAQGAAFRFLGFEGKEAGYMIIFCYCAVAYLIAWACIKTLVPRYKKVEV
ncbi:MAG: MFS transporter [Bacteroidaceae bacterium]|nr:MFS transporter [Bacteroidaceae bacterium]